MLEMPKQKGPPILVANWKMNGTLQSINRLLCDLKRDFLDKELESGQVIILPPHVYLQIVAKDLSGTSILIGAQDTDERETGSVTGGVSAKMLLDVGCEYVLLGHSERRKLFNEGDGIIFQKLKQALKVGLKAIVCVGESLEQRNSGQVLEVIANQLKPIISQESLPKSEELLIAYEPVWAIGSNKSATMQQIGNALSEIRKILRNVDLNLSDSTKILYGGSVTEKNIAEILALDEVVDAGIILEVDPLTIVNRALMRSSDGETPDHWHKKTAQKLRLAFG